MNKLKLKNYNFEKTLLGGQAFNWDFINDSYYGFTTNRIIKIEPTSSGILWQTYPHSNDEIYIRNYLNIDIDYDTILKDINKDSNIAQAIDSVKNVRILNQDFEQTLFSFILTAHKNIKAVRKVIRDLSREYGTKIVVDDIEFFTFPTTEKLASLSESDIRKYGAGFRSGYIVDAAKILLDNNNMGSQLKSMYEHSARVELLKFKGIGDKVADCILTFSLGFYTVTPLDIWALRVLSDMYGLNIKAKYSTLRQWYSEYFGENTAWAGQFLFEYLRSNYQDIKKVSNVN